MRTEEALLGPSRPAGGDDSYDVDVAFGPDHKNQATLDWIDGQETVFIRGMSIVKKLEIVRTGTKELARLLEGDAMFLLVERLSVRSHVTFTVTV
jgi:hypothetical protein